MSSELSVPEDLCLDGPLWQFAGGFWAQAAAQKTALLLQERGWSVTDILCALWLARQGRSFDGTGIDQAVFWRGQVTEPLRRVRKAIRKHNPATDQARDRIARGELEAEKVELALAYRSLTGDNPLWTLVNEPVNESTVMTLALKNLQAAAPEKAMDNETGRLLETLTTEFQAYIEGERQTC